MDGQEFTITFAASDADIDASFAVMSELRTNFTDPAVYRHQIRPVVQDGAIAMDRLFEPSDEQLDDQA